MNPDSRGFAARIHLALLQEDRAAFARHELLYVRLAYQYGIEVFEISRLSGISLERVRELLTAGEPTG